MEAYLHISSKLKLGGTAHENALKSISTVSLPGQNTDEVDIAGQLITGIYDKLQGTFSFKVQFIKQKFDDEYCLYCILPPNMVWDGSV